MRCEAMRRVRDWGVSVMTGLRDYKKRKQV